MTREERIKRSWQPHLAHKLVIQQGFARAALYDPRDPWEIDINDGVETVTFVGERNFWHEDGITHRWYDVTCEGVYVGKVRY